MPSFQLWDRIRAYFKQANLYRVDNLYSDQDDVERVTQGGQLLNVGRQSALLEQTNLQINRLERYKDYDMMDQTGEISLALDIYADESSLVDPERKHSVLVKAKNKKVKKVIEDFLYNTLMIDREIRPIIRYLCKFGDFAAEIVPTKHRNGVSGYRFMNIYNFTRIHTKYDDLVGFYYQNAVAGEPEFLYPWQVLHMRLTSLENIYEPYGKCCIEGTLVDTPNGQKRIEEIRSGEIVYSFDGMHNVPTRVIDLVDNGYKQTYSIHTSCRRLDLTSNHPVMTYQGNNLVYKQVNELSHGDMIIVPEKDNIVVEGISRIEKRDNKQVFDIGVESNYHNFVANGAVVHNSILDGGRKDYKRLRLMEDAALIYRVCVRGDTRVSTPDGYKHVRDIEVGDTAFCLDRDIEQKPTKIINCVCNGRHKIYRVFSRHREIFTNATHPILVVSPYKKDGVLYHDKLEYVDTQDLKTLENTCAKHYCHRFLLPRIENEELIKLEHPDVPIYARLSEPVNCSIGKDSNTTIKAFLSEHAYIEKDLAESILQEINIKQNLEYMKGWCYNFPQRICRQYNVPLVADEDFAKWFGFMIGDGYVSTRGRIKQVGFALGDDREINEQYKQLFEKIVTEVSFGQDEDYRLGSYYVYSKHLVDFMLINGFIQGAENKRIPSWVYRSPRKIQIAFIDGYLDADGNSRYFKGGITEGHTIECCNEKLVEDFKELIDRMGWSAGLISHRKRDGGHIIDKKTNRTMPDTESWVLYFTKEELPEHERILGVEEIGEDLVYDVTVENDVHNVIYNGIYTHQTRAPEKRIFNIPIGQIPPHQVPQYIQLLARQMKKHRFVDPGTGEINERWNPLIQEDDFWMPKRPDGTGPSIDTLPGAENLDKIADIEYFKKKMVSGLKIPFSRVGIGDPSESDGKSLSSVSPEFAKSVQWIQREVVLGLKKICLVHLALRNHDVSDMREFDLYMTAASAIDELYRIETWNTRSNIMGNLKDLGWFPPEWIIERFTDLTPDEILSLKANSDNALKEPDIKEEDLDEDEKELLNETMKSIYEAQKIQEQTNSEKDYGLSVESFLNKNEFDGIEKGSIGPVSVDTKVIEEAKEDYLLALKRMDDSFVMSQPVTRTIAEGVEEYTSDYATE